MEKTSPWEEILWFLRIPSGVNKRPMTLSSGRFWLFYEEMFWSLGRHLVFEEKTLGYSIRIHSRLLWACLQGKDLLVFWKKIVCFFWKRPADRFGKRPASILGEDQLLFPKRPASLSFWSSRRSLPAHLGEVLLFIS